MEGNVSAATIYYYDNCLYVATCSFRGYLICFDLVYKNKKLSWNTKEILFFNKAILEGKEISFTIISMKQKKNNKTSNYTPMFDILRGKYA